MRASQDGGDFTHPKNQVSTKPRPGRMEGTDKPVFLPTAYTVLTHEKGLPESSE